MRSNKVWTILLAFQVGGSPLLQGTVQPSLPTMPGAHRTISASEALSLVAVFACEGPQATWQTRRQLIRSALLFAEMRRVFAQAVAANPQEADLLQYARAIATAGFNQDSSQLSNLSSLTNVLAAVIRQNISVQPAVAAQVLNDLIATLESLIHVPLTERRYDTVLLTIIQVLDLTLYPHFWDNLPSGVYDNLLGRLQTIIPVYPPGQVSAQLASLVTDIVTRTPHAPTPQPPTDAPSIPGRFKPMQSLFLTAEDLSQTQSRLNAGDPWTQSHLNDLVVIAAAAPTLDAIPEVMTYAPDASDLLAQQGIALAILWRLGRVPEGSQSFERARKIMQSFTSGFHSTEPYLLSNDGLDFASSVPSFVYLFELLAPSLSAADAQPIVDKFARMAERIQETAYGSQTSLDPDVRRARLLSNHRTWQDTAVVTAGLASGRLDLVQWALGTENPADQDGSLRFHLREAYGPDDLILEGPFGYQAYDGIAVAMAAMAAKNAGAADLSTYLDGRLRRIFLAMIQYRRPDWTTPVAGDSGRINIAQYAPLFALTNRLYGGDPAFSLVMANEQPMGFSSWFVLARTQELWISPGDPADPSPAPARQDGLGLIEFRQNPSLSNSGSMTVFQAQNHRDSHQLANNLAIEASFNAANLSVAFNPGTSAHTDPAMDADYWRSRAANIMEWNGQVPLGSASFDENGAHSNITFLDERRSPAGAVHAAQGVMTGGYIQNGSETAVRSFVQVDGPRGQPGYRFVRSTLSGPASGQSPSASSLWHGPIGGTLEALSVRTASFMPDPQNPTFRYVKAVERSGAAVTTPWHIRWRLPNGIGLQMNVLASGDGTQITWGIGPENAPFFQMLDNIPASKPADYHSSVVMQDLMPGQMPANVTALSSAQTGTSGAVIEAAGGRDWVALADRPGMYHLSNPADGGESFVFQGPYSVARIAQGAIDLFGPVENAQLHAPGIRIVRHNGIALPRTAWREENGYVHIVVRPSRPAPIRRAERPRELRMRA